MTIGQWSLSTPQVGRRAADIGREITAAGAPPSRLRCNPQHRRNLRIVERWRCDRDTIYAEN